MAPAPMFRSASNVHAARQASFCSLRQGLPAADPSSLRRASRASGGRPTVADAPSGRLGPGPRRPTSRGEPLGAVMAHHLYVYRRTWKGSVIGRFVSPLFFLLSMGLGLGALVDARAGGVEVASTS